MLTLMLESQELGAIVLLDYCDYISWGFWVGCVLLFSNKI